MAAVYSAARRPVEGGAPRSARNPHPQQTLQTDFTVQAIVAHGLMPKCGWLRICVDPSEERMERGITMNAKLWIGIGLITTTLLAGKASAETFYLANGDVIEGKIISERTDRWVVDVGRGEIEVLKADLARIVPAPRK